MLQEFGLYRDNSVFSLLVASAAKGNEVTWMIGLYGIAIKFTKRPDVMNIMRESLLALTAMLTNVVIALTNSTSNFRPIRAVNNAVRYSTLPKPMIGLAVVDMKAHLRAKARIAPLYFGGYCLKQRSTDFTGSCNAISSMKIKAFLRTILPAVRCLGLVHFKRLTTNGTNGLNAPEAASPRAFRAAIVTHFSTRGANLNRLVAMGAMLIWFLFPIRMIAGATTKVMLSNCTWLNLFWLTAVSTMDRNAGHVASPVMRPEFGVGGWSGNQPCQRVIKPLKPTQIIP